MDNTDVFHGVQDSLCDSVLPIPRPAAEYQKITTDENGCAQLCVEISRMFPALEDAHSFSDFENKCVAYSWDSNRKNKCELYGAFPLLRGVGHPDFMLGEGEESKCRLMKGYEYE